jgi:hypothetical protein
MSYATQFIANIADDRDRLQDLKATLSHWVQATHRYAEETRDPYAFATYRNLEFVLEGLHRTVEQTIALIAKEEDSDIVERTSRLHVSLIKHPAP